MASDVIKSTDRMIILSICVCFVAFAALTPAVSGIANRMNKIGKDLKQDLSEALQLAVVNYSDPNITVNYTSKIDTNMKGMVPLYDITRKAIDLIQTKDAYPEGYLTISDGQIELQPISESWKELLLHYSGVLAVALLISLYGILIFFIGFCFCCCRCAGACGASTQPFDKKHDKCKKILLALLLIGIITLFMFGVVCVFVTNQHMHDSTVELPTTAKSSLDDVRTYLNATNTEFSWLLENNYEELHKKLLGLIHSSGMKISAQLELFSHAVSVTTLNNMVKDLDRVRYNLETVQNITRSLRTNAGRLDDSLRQVKKELLKTLSHCNASQCRSISSKYNINDLKTEIHHARLPNVTGLLENITDILNGNIQKEVNDGHEKFNNIKRQIEETVNKQIPSLESVLTDTGNEIHNLSKQITEEIQNIDRMVTKNGYPGVEKGQRYIDEYAKYRWQAGLAAGLVLLVVLICSFLGLTCGVCGSRPHGYSDDCCNKGSGASFLMFGVGVMFLFGIVLAALMLVHFVVGVISQRAVCDPLNDPQNNRLFGHIDDFVNLEHLLYGKNEEQNMTLSNVILACHNNDTLYNVLHLYRRLNLDEIKERIEKELQDKISQITNQTNFENSQFTILSEPAKASLLRLSDSGLSTFRFDTITDKLITNITSIELSSLARQLREKAAEFGPKSEYQQIRRSLEDAADSVERCQVEIVDKIMSDINLLNATAIELLEKVRFNRSSFSEAVRYLLDETSTAEIYLSEQGPDVIRNLTHEFAGGVAGMVGVYLARVVNKIKYDVGKCGPVSNVLNVTIHSTCEHIVMPFNGYWVSLGWCLLLFIPMIIFFVKLATLYKKSDPYPGPLVEAEYLYDTSADRDNIPLANAYSGGVGGGEKRVGRGTRGERISRAGASTGTAPDSTDAHNPRRYHDMAPKQWEEGPPRYNGPAEYERPPPYYYPGTSDRE